ncbi:MAG: hypothetical protein NC321_08725 [Clostridium sp.]|nr:hypothetical protein [Clostridium sp.]MCM1386427.1 hypothetical protein [Bacillus sp. (in: firmicutes)]MCM1425003.1 hypothetical protein [Eubacterium sp.]
MKFYKNLYIGDTIKEPNKVKRKLKHHAGQLRVFVIILASGSDQLEICHNMLLEQPYYKKKENAPYIIGIAGSYEEAVALVCEIAKEAVAQNGDADLKKYLFPEFQAAGKA